MAEIEHNHHEGNKAPLFERFTRGSEKLNDLGQPVLLRMFAEFLGQTRDVVSGAAVVCELLENDRRLVEMDQRPLLAPIQHEGLARLAMRSLRSLDDQASRQLDAIERYATPTERH